MQTPNTAVVRVPLKWSKMEKEILQENVIPELLDIDGLVKWAEACNMADENAVRNYVEAIRPYHFARLVYPVVPDNDVCREAFTVFLHFVIALYICDDILEKQCDAGKLEKICDAFDQLDVELSNIFPTIPTIDELKTSLEYVQEAKLIAVVTILTDYICRIVAVLLKNNTFPINDVFDFRRRLSHSVSVDLKAVKLEKKMARGVSENPNKLLWRRIFEGAPITCLMSLEISSLSIGRCKEQIPAVIEMYVVSSLCCIITNDLYSYYRETNEDLKCDNIIKLWLQQNTIASVDEGVFKIVRILNSTVKYMLKKVATVKKEFPNNREIQNLYEYIAIASIGWMYIHEQGTYRYRDSPWRINFVDIKEEDIPQFLAEKDTYAEDVLNQFLSSNDEAIKLINALSQVTAISEESMSGK